MSHYGDEVAWRENERAGDRMRLNPSPVASYQQTIETLLLDYPPIIKARGWIGAVRAWLTHPRAGEEEMFAEALCELSRLRREVAV